MSALEFSTVRSDALCAQESSSAHWVMQHCNVAVPVENQPSIATTPQQQAAAPLPTGAVMAAPSDGLEEDRPEGQAGASWGSKSFLLVWADTAEPVRLTPSVLLAHLILCSRRVCSCSACIHCHIASAAWHLPFLMLAFPVHACQPTTVC